MEDLFPALIVIIGAIVSLASSARKAKEKQAAENHQRAAAAARIQAAQQKMKAAAKPAQPMSAPARPHVVAQPQVHTHVQPDCETHDTTGSLNYASTEGKDPCHEEQLTHRRTADESSSEIGGLTFDWSGENLVKAFVMQEVLTRPANRAAQHRAGHNI